ncbi:MAG: hypothetical protein JSW10_04600 [Pseudomonadota bacterium]|nr:MAG: hypothetical protein JSW10_04600 [Pseudomonadota bacterium]
MKPSLKTRLVRWLSHWLTRERPPSNSNAPMCNFERLRYEIRPGDVILVEGRSQVSRVIKNITQSAWTHAALYIGRVYDIHDPARREQLRTHYHGDPNQQLIIEALLGEGTVVHPLSKYRNEHLRICRARGIAPDDAQRVIEYAIGRLGTDYDLRQLLDLARFMFPYGILPRRWRSSLFSHNAGAPTRTVCSTMLAEAFHAVHFPMLPFTERSEHGTINLHQRNPRLYTPRDFDYSPYFDIIKYPYFDLDDVASYRRLPWSDKRRYCNDPNDCYIAPPPQDAHDAGSAHRDGQQELPAQVSKQSPPRAARSINLLNHAVRAKRKTA